MRPQSYVKPRVSEKLTTAHVILIHQPQVPSPIKCTWYKIADRRTYSLPDNGKLHANGTLELLPIERGYNIYTDAAGKFHGCSNP